MNTKINLNEIVVYLTTKENLIKIAGSSLLGILTVYIGKIWYSYRFFKKFGIKTPPYKFFWGNFPDIRKNKNYSEVLKKWTEKYGKTYGYFEGHLPILVTSDVEIIEEVFVKQYSCFSARKKGPLERGEDDSLISVFSATKSRWKRMRNIMNPTFSSSKLRELNPLMIMCTERLINKLSENTDIEINITEFLKRFTMDTIWNCAFGIDTDTQNEKNNPFFKRSEEIFQTSANYNLPMYLGVYFHEFKKQILNILIFLNNIVFKFGNQENVIPFLWIRKKIMDVYFKRVNDQNIKKRDYIQLLIEAGDTHDNFKAKDNNNNNINFKELHIEKHMSEQEIQMNLVVFLLAGYETTSTALSYSFYVLATHAEEQEKLIHEIDEHFPNDSQISPNLDNIQKLEYLDLFIKETLRMYPIGNSVVARRCVNPTKIKDLNIPNDLTIAVDVLSLHYDKKLWGPEDPNEFYPLRFSNERKRHPMAFQGFGQGPRNCIGMKFALLEAKIALVKILKNYKILPLENMKLEYVEGVVRSPKNGVMIMIKKR